MDFKQTRCALGENCLIYLAMFELVEDGVGGVGGVHACGLMDKKL